MNEEKILEAVDQFNLTEWDKETVLDMVEVMYGRFYEKDQDDVVIKGLEEEWQYERERVLRKGFIDLWGWIDDEQLLVVDYKTTKKLGGSSYDRDNWVKREMYSNQLERYAHALCVKYGLEPSSMVGEIRGISVKPPHKIEVIQRELDINSFDYDEKLWSGVEHAYRNKLGFKTPWPKNMPDGCFAFGPKYPCEFFRYCTGKEEFIIPEELDVEVLSKSHSSDKSLKRCPERLRLLTLARNLGMMEDESEEATLGKAFHEGMRVAYETSGLDRW